MAMSLLCGKEKRTNLATTDIMKHEILEKALARSTDRAVTF